MPLLLLPRCQVRYRDGMLVATKGEKYIVEKIGEDWDGGSRGKVRAGRATALALLGAPAGLQHDQRCKMHKHEESCLPGGVQVMSKGKRGKGFY